MILNMLGLYYTPGSLLDDWRAILAGNLTVSHLLPGRLGPPVGEKTVLRHKILKILIKKVQTELLGRIGCPPI